MGHKCYFNISYTVVHWFSNLICFKDLCKNRIKFWLKLYSGNLGFRIQFVPKNCWRTENFTTRNNENTIGSHLLSSCWFNWFETICSIIQHIVIIDSIQLNPSSKRCSCQVVQNHKRFNSGVSRHAYYIAIDVKTCIYSNEPVNLFEYFKMNKFW